MHFSSSSRFFLYRTGLDSYPRSKQSHETGYGVSITWYTHQILRFYEKTILRFRTVFIISPLFKSREVGSGPMQIIQVREAKKFPIWSEKNPEHMFL